MDHDDGFAGMRFAVEWRRRSRLQGQPASIVRDGDDSDGDGFALLDALALASLANLGVRLRAGWVGFER